MSSCCCCRFPSLDKLSVRQSLHHLLGVIVVVEVLNLMSNFGSERVVVDVCLSVGLSGFHPRNVLVFRFVDQSGNSFICGIFRRT